MAKVEVTMPKMGESITEGTVIEWHKKPGDAVELDETLLEIGTDKVDTEVPSPAAGILSEVMVEAGDTVEVGTVIAVLDPDGEGDAAGEGESEDGQEEDGEAGSHREGEAEPEEKEPEVPDDELKEATFEAAGGDMLDIVMPKMGESITEGTILTWHKQPGDEVDLDETILEIGTDKVDTEVPSPAEGVLAEILVEEGETVEVGTVIAKLTTDRAASTGKQERAKEGEQDGETEKPGEGGRQETPPGDGSQPSGDGTVRQPVPAGGGGKIERHGSDGRFFSPLVRSIAEEEGLSMQELEAIGGSGREGRVTKQDVLGYLETRQEPSTQPAGEYEASGYDGGVEIVEMDRIRQMIAEHMVMSKKTSPHVTSFAEADVTNLVRLREKSKAEFLEREGVKLTFTPFFVKAAVDALREHEILNASVDDAKIILKKDFHIGIAVAIGKTGLVVPVIRDAGGKNLIGLAQTAADLADRVRNKRLQPDDLQGGTFTVTNIGSLGSIMGTPIINQPQVGILATGAIRKRPVVVEDPELGDIIAIRHMMNLSLSYDHRIVDGAMAASFLQHIVEQLGSYKPDGEI